MQKLTLEVIASTTIWLGSFIGGILLILKYSKKLINKVITEPILKEISSVKENLNVVGADQCKNYLVRFLADVENGKKLSEVEIERAYDAFEKYTEVYHGNSYIHDRWDKLMKNGRK